MEAILSAKSLEKLVFNCIGYTRNDAIPNAIKVSYQISYLIPHRKLLDFSSGEIHKSVFQDLHIQTGVVDP
jgi:hypothetical protein